MFTRKSALQHLLSSMGIEISPEELMKKYNEAKDIMPKLAVFVNGLDERLQRMEKKQDEIIRALAVLGGSPRG